MRCFQKYCFKNVIVCSLKDLFLIFCVIQVAFMDFLKFCCCSYALSIQMNIIGFVLRLSLINLFSYTNLSSKNNVYTEGGFTFSSLLLATLQEFDGYRAISLLVSHQCSAENFSYTGSHSKLCTKTKCQVITHFVFVLGD
eukprot:TRINITY_DN9843_c0_g1_i2.p4 TRINITY_DN9843_c0_g1~~TRINITY_DN9843_c0_g1_i2.p4  ORF type:complete len:140 (-),score=1.85 TRINITY_DN9843_c0_g1_i2:395-814(-)